MNASQQYEYRLSIIYFTFRVILAICLGGISIADQLWSIEGNYQNTFFLIGAAIYFFIAILSLIITSINQTPPLKKTLFVAIFIDIIFCITFIHLSGGFRTGLAILLLSPITIGSIFFSGSIAFSIASIAIIGMLLDVLYIASIIPNDSKYFIPAGLLGILFFITSLITQVIARYIRSTEKLVVENIEKTKSLIILNDMIVQKMLTGIIVINKNGEIQLSNDIAKDLLKLSLGKNNTITNKLKDLFIQWQKNPYLKIEPFRDGPGLPIIKINFSLITAGNPETIIFIENQNVLNQQAQHLKLSSLGRLSASIAHEIRNPLNAISHASQLLLETNEHDSENFRLLNMISNHTKRINGIIGNVLDISRRVPTQPQKLILLSSIEKIINHYKDRYPNAIFETNISNDIEVSFDESQLHQVLTNLIENALRYSTETTGLPWAKINAHIQSGNVELSIYDQGKGIKPEDVEKAFEPFYTTHKMGTGLGLYVAKELCEMNQAILDYIYDENDVGFFSIKFAHFNKNINTY
jgi:two-component system sensor histidine kinase PilS (NtrC family)